jgi:hypothetical protein
MWRGLLVQMIATGGMITGTVGAGGAENCELQFQLQRRTGTNPNTWTNVGTMATSSSITNEGTASRTATRNAPNTGVHRFLARTRYLGYPEGARFTPWIPSGNFTV